MTVQVALQPTSNKDSRKHYADTIARPVPLERIRKVDSSLASDLEAGGAVNSVLMWGVTPGSGDVNKKKWERLNEGDIALFARDGGIISSARVCAKTHSEELAVELWNRNKKGETWEYIYFVEDLKPQSIPYATLNAAAGYKSTNKIQGFDVLDIAISGAVIAGLKLREDYPDLPPEKPGGDHDLEIALVLVENEVTADRKFDDWKDVTGERYHFPNQYRNRCIEGTPFVYYRGVRRAGGKRGRPEYFGIGRIGEVWRDPSVLESAPKKDWKWFCSIDDYVPFGSPVPAIDGAEKFEDIPQNQWGVGVRNIESAVLSRIALAADVNPLASINAARPPDLPAIEDVDPVGGTGLLVPRKATPSGKSATGQGGSPRRSRHSKLIGDFGEEIALKHLRKELSGVEAASLRWVADENEKPGWDIEYRRDDAALIAVEVKATSGSRFASIEITENEWSAAREMKERFCLLLVSNVKSLKPAIQVIWDPASLVDRGTWSSEATHYRLQALSEEGD